MKPRILLADDHALVLEALVCVLGDEFEVVATAPEGRALVALAVQFAPDLVILDLNMPSLSGIEVLRVLAPQLPTTRFVVLTMHNDRAYVHAAFTAGAHGYLVKESSPEQMLAAIRSVLRGERFISPDVGVTLGALGGESSSATREGSGALTERQLEVVRRVAAGLPYKRIAAELGISVKTVEFHKASIARQLGLKTTAALTRWAIAHGVTLADAGDSDPRSAAAGSGVRVVDVTGRDG